MKKAAKTKKLEFRSDATLAVRYRPKTVDDLIGQDSAVSQIRGFIKKKNIPKTIGIFGNSGCGKTTIGRMLGEMVNGGPFDIEEFDFGTENGIAEVRKIPNRMQYKPLRGHLRFFILDEAHLLTKTSASALLKKIEEPPKHVVVILCTNEPDKLLPTIRNRCEKIYVGTVAAEETVALLTRVCKAEGIDFGKHKKQVFQYIAENCGGVPREALQMLSATHNIYTGLEGKEIKLEKLISALSPEVEMVAAKLYLSLLRKKAAGVVNAIYATKDYHALSYRLLDISTYILQHQSKVASYQTPIRKKVLGYVQDEELGKSVKQLMLVHNAIVTCRRDLFQASVTPDQVMLSILSGVI